jgi:hypothetical protein
LDYLQEESKVLRKVVCLELSFLAILAILIGQDRLFLHSHSHRLGYSAALCRDGQNPWNECGQILRGAA